MDLKDKKVLVIGCGLSGIAAARMLYQLGAVSILYDGNETLKEAAVRDKLGFDFNGEIYIGPFLEQYLEDLVLAVISPGVPTDLPFVKQIREHGIPVWGEIELAWQFGRGRVLAITGTNGKTTTTALLGEILKRNFKNSFVVGNIGTPYTSIALNTADDSVIAAEVSSFQLETTAEFKPTVSAILNLTPDHLDRHHTFEGYVAAKKKITENQTEEDTCVLNYDDPLVREISRKIHSKVLFFSTETKPSPGVYLDGGVIYWDDGADCQEICRVNQVHLLGHHNYQNVMAAAAIALSAGVPVSVIKESVMNFIAVEHRIEFVREKDGVRYYNDSKGTNPDAAIKAVGAMEWPTYLIAGGYDKNSSYEEWIRSFDGKVKAMVLIGETREKIAEAAKTCGFTNIIFADTLEEAVSVCAEKAKEGEAVLLSPACASWGMFKNYEQRGKMFKQLVNNL